MSTPESWIGSTIDQRYAIDKRVARGGMSTVYLARDQRLHRDVAIKVLFPHMAEDRKVVQRFEQEARNSALIAHPNVVQVLDQGQTRETAYMVMEYVPGATLRTLLKRGPMTPRLTLAYAHAVLSGLSAAHRAGLVHRDIKPENVLVSPEGRIKLADFGLARAATHHSGTSTLMGTVAYISPELLSGEGADERADIYAVGILLYEMLTGVQPYTGDSPVRVAFQHVNSTVPSPSSYVPGLAAPLDELVHEATRIDPDDRPKNADALLELISSARTRLTEEELDFDGATTKHRSRHQPQTDHSDAAATATSVMPAAAPVQSAPAEEDSTVALGEDFPTADDGPHQEAPTSVLSESAADPPPPPQTEESSASAQRWSSLAEEDRQTVAEVPLPSRLSVQETETASQPAAAPARRSFDPGAGKKTRQRPIEQLRRPTPARRGIAVAVAMIAFAVVMLIAFQLGISNSIIPSLGGSGQ